MPVVAIPFRSPPAFALPEQVLADMRRQAPPVAASEALGLLEQIDAGDLLAVVFRDPAGGLAAGAIAGADAGGRAALATGLLQLARAEGETDLVRQALRGRQPLLVMGELAADDHAVFPAALASHLLAGAASAAVGFFYVFPLLDAADHPHGALVIGRALADGPLNHDQPAIAQALATMLGALAAPATAS